jgi:hypothetical protein
LFGGAALGLGSTCSLFFYSFFFLFSFLTWAAHVSWAGFTGWAESHMGWAGFLRNRNGPTNGIYQFSSKTEVVFFTGVFVLLTKSKNYEI